MKKIIFLFSISIITLFSCSSEGDVGNNIINNNVNESNVLLKKIIDSTEGVAEFSYNGNKLYRITSSSGTYEEYTYSGD